MDEPSILSSHTTGTMWPKASFTRSSQASSSPKSMALSSEYMRRSWRTGANCSPTYPPTRCVGLDGSTRSGWASSSSRSSRMSESNAPSEISGASLA